MASTVAIMVSTVAILVSIIIEFDKNLLLLANVWRGFLCNVLLNASRHFYQGSTGQDSEMVETTNRELDFAFRTKAWTVRASKKIYLTLIHISVTGHVIPISKFELVVPESVLNLPT